MTTASPDVHVEVAEAAAARGAAFIEAPVLGCLPAAAEGHLLVLVGRGRHRHRQGPTRPRRPR